MIGMPTMRQVLRACSIGFFLALALTPRVNAQRAASPLAWPSVTREAKPWTRWWWLGSAVDKRGISEQLAELNAAGTPTGFQTRLEEETIGGVAVFLKPGLVNNVEVSRKDFRGTNPRITITGFHIKIDGCVGQSFIRSYATLTASTEQTSDVITYMGVTKAV